MEDVQRLESSTISSSNNEGVTTAKTDLENVTSPQKLQITSTQNDEMPKSGKPDDQVIAGMVADNKESGESIKFQKESVTDEAPVNTISEIKRILRQKNHSVGLDTPLYTIIAACVALSFAAFCITVLVIWKASRHVSAKSRLSNLDQKNLNQIELCMDKKNTQSDLNMCFSGIPPNGEIWREIKSTTPTVF